MPTVKVLIRDGLTCPPTWFHSFRDLTLYCVMFVPGVVLVESADPDPFYHWLKPRGGMDFVSDFVAPGREDGLRIDTAHNFGRTIVTDRIVPENVHGLIRHVEAYARSLR